MKTKWFLFLLLMSSSCRPGYDFCPPVCDTPETFFSEGGEGRVDLDWWNSFEDTQLTRYIELAAHENKDVRGALESICRARATRLTVASRLYPDIDAEARYNRNSFNTFFGGAGDIDPANIASVTTNFDQEIFFLGLDAIWEIDLFGRTRKQVEAASYRIGSAIENYRSVLLTVFAETAKNYLDARGFQELIAQREKHISTLEKSIELRRQNEEAGIASSLELLDIESTLARLRADLPPLYLELYTRIFRLSVLMGQFPGALIAEIEPRKPLPELPALVATGLPSELLQRRPDIRQAEAELAAATADVGVAYLDYFPRLFLAGSIGRQRFALPNQVFDNFVWSYTADLLTPFFKAGRIGANIRAEKAQAMEAFFQYENAILKAFEETESHIFGYKTERERGELLFAALSEQRESLRMTHLLVEEGISDLLSLYAKEIDVLQAQDLLTESKIRAHNALISLYKSLGGGWECDPFVSDESN